MEILGLSTVGTYYGSELIAFMMFYVANQSDESVSLCKLLLATC